MKYIYLFIENISMYLYLILMLRLLGKKEMSRLTIFDLIVFLLISELMTLSIGDSDITFFYGAFCVLVIVLLDKGVSYLVMKFKPLKRMIEGKPTYIIFQGKIDLKMMKKLNYSIDDLYHQIRGQSVSSLSEVEFALLETDGALSVLTKKDNVTLIPESVIIDGKIRDDILCLMNKDEQWLIEQLKEKGIYDYRELMFCIIEKDHFYYKKKKAR